MDLATARRIVDTLAHGFHPVTGERLPPEALTNEPDVVRALLISSRALEAAAGPLARGVRVAPANAGKAWTAADDERLVAGHAAGESPKALAESLGRTRFGVEQRLIKLGKLPAPPGGGRFGGGWKAQAAGATTQGVSTPA